MAQTFNAVIAAVLVVGVASVPIQSESPRALCKVVGSLRSRPQSGDYLATVYYESLKRTLSPDAALGTTQFQFARVQHSGAGLSLAMGTFEEGEGEIVLADDGVAYQPGPNAAPCTVVLHDESHFGMSAGSGVPLTDYSFVGDLDSWVADVLFVGRYTDPNGGHYSFDRDGKAMFDGKPVSYSFDQADGLGFQYGTVVINGQNFRFERTRTSLTIFGPLRSDSPSGGSPKWALKVENVVR